MKLPYKREQIIPHKLDCNACGDTGKVLATSRNPDLSALPFAFRCAFCWRGRRAYQFPLWDERWAKDYEILTGVQGAAS